MNLIQNRRYWHCFCKDFEGCKLNYNRGRRYCFLCQIEDHGDIEDVENIKYSPIKRFKYASELFEDLVKCVKIKSDIAECWGREFEYKWRDISEGTCGSCYLSEIIEF